MSHIMSRISSSDDDLTDDVNGLLLTDTERQASPSDENSSEPNTSVSSRITYRLYISHFLSTWNSRVFEFGAVLYLATIFPGTLLPMSVYALVRGISAIVFAPSVGQYIDSENRLKVVRVSIGER